MALCTTLCCARVVPVAQAWNKEENDYHSSLLTKWTTDPPKTINITQPEVGATKAQRACLLHS